MKRKNKIRLFWGSIILLLALVVSLQLNSVTASTTRDFITITVHGGDTLWSIAQEYAVDSNQDIRETIDDILDLNDMSSANLIIGQSLKIPQ